MASAGLTSEDLLALIIKERTKEQDVVPPGWKSCDQWAKEWGTSRSRTSDLLVFAVKKGVMERKDFRIMCGKKRCAVGHFKQVKKGR